MSETEKTETEKTETEKTESRQTPWDIALEALHHVITHNLWMKVLAVAISVVLWAGLISQDETLTREKTFNDVNVSINGADTMRRNGYIVTSDLETMLSGVSITAAVPQKQYENAEASAYNVRVDLSKINGTGIQEVRLINSNSSTYGRVVNTSPSSVQVVVEDYVIRQKIPVSVNVGTIPDGWYMSKPEVDPVVITVAGPKSVVETILRAKGYLDPSTIEWEEGTVLTPVSFNLVDRSGEIVNNSLVQITSDSTIIDTVLAETQILPTKSFDVTGLIETYNSVAKGYEIAGIRISPETIRVAATGDVLEQLSDIPLESRKINVKNLKETTKFQLKVLKPSEDAILYNDTVTVTVEISPKEEE